MTAVSSPLNTNSERIDSVILSTGPTGLLKRAVAGSSRTVTGGDVNAAAQEVGTHTDDAAFTVATDAVVTIGALADETSTDSVDEGDAGALRMTLNRRLITAGHLVDDAAFGVATDYVTPIAGLADETSPDSVNEGDTGALRMTLARNLHVVNVADAAAVTTVNSTATSTTLLAANANRIGATFFNTDANNLYLKFGATASTSSFTIKIATGAYYELPQPVYRGIIDGIWDVDGAGLVAITELT